jgi:hypothetical protein
MRNKNFGIEEKKFLKEIINIGIIDYDKYKFSEVGKKILIKLSLDIFKLTPKEKQVVSSFTMNWVNKNENILDELQTNFYNKNPLNYLNVGKVERELMRKSDFINSIREKVNSKKIYMSYENVFSKIEKIKNLNDIYLSTSDGKPYKIAFVDYSNKEYLKWTFENFERTIFIKAKKIEFKQLRKLYKTELNRMQALEIFEKYNQKSSEMKFCEELLK